MVLGFVRALCKRAGLCWRRRFGHSADDDAEYFSGERGGRYCLRGRFPSAREFARESTSSGRNNALSEPTEAEQRFIALLHMWVDVFQRRRVVRRRRDSSAQRAVKLGTLGSMPSVRASAKAA